MPFSNEWLTNPIHDPYRVMLMEHDHSQGTIRLATKPFMDNNGNPYDDFLIDGAPRLDDSLDEDSAWGNFTAINNIEPDIWQSYHFSGYPWRWYWGDIRWPKAQFSQIAAGINEDVQRDELTFSFDLGDRGFLLEKQVSPDGELVNLGQSRNISPRLVDYPSQTYEVHSGPVIDIPAVYDNGLLVEYTKNLFDGTITLARTPQGALSADVVEANDTLPEMVAELAYRAGFEVSESYGLASWQLEAKLRIDCTDKTFAAALTAICSSVGVNWRLNSLGSIEVISDQIIPVDDIVLTVDDVTDLQLSSSDLPVEKVVVYYDQNPTVLNNSVMKGAVEAGAITEVDRDWFNTEYRKIERTTQAMTGILSETVEYTSLLINPDDADLFASLMEYRHAAARRYYRGKITNISYGLQIGDMVRIEYPGVTGVALINHLVRGAEGDLSDMEIRL